VGPEETGTAGYQNLFS